MRDGLPDDWQAVQIITDAANVQPIKNWLTENLGNPMVFNGDGTRGYAWQPTPRTFSIWLLQSNSLCTIQISSAQPGQTISQKTTAANITKYPEHHEAP